jgi:glycosyltransferase involved in cell wall biosynthesis
LLAAMAAASMSAPLRDERHDSTAHRADKMGQLPSSLSPRPSPSLALLIVNSIQAYGGGEKWALQTALGLTQRGHRVAFACREGSELAERARALGLEAFLLAMPSDLSLSAIARLALLARSWRPDVLLCCNQRALRLGAPAARLAGVPRVVMRDGLQGSLRGSRYNRWMARLVDGFIVNADATRRELLTWLPADRVKVIYNGIELPPYDQAREGAELRRALGCPTGAPVLLSVARLVSDKDHATLLTAFRRVAQRDERARLWIAGDGPLRPTLAAQVERFGLSEWVAFLGFRGDVPRLLAAADVLVISSLREGLPNVALEAMAARRPIVATAVSGIPELVRDGETGLLVPPAAPDALASALAVLVGDPVRRRQMGERGRRRVEQWFEASAILDQWEQYLLRLLAREVRE